jgi:hypothetical protein
MTSIWICYIVGAVLRLIIKLGRYLRAAYGHGQTKSQAFWDWFFSPTWENGISWLATIGFVWLGGYLYINRVETFLGIEKLPLNHPVAFLLGIAMEEYVPNISKWLFGLLPFTKANQGE